MQVVTGKNEIRNYGKRNSALMSVFAVIEHKLNKNLKEAEKADFENLTDKHLYLSAYRKALRDLLELKPK